jgi:hypothetical protein
VAVVILHVYKYMNLITNKFTFRSGGLHEKHVVATWNLGNHLSIRLYTGKPRKTCVEVAGRKTFRVLTSVILKIICDYFPQQHKQVCLYIEIRLFSVR